MVDIGVGDTIGTDVETFGTGMDDAIVTDMDTVDTGMENAIGTDIDTPEVELLVDKLLQDELLDDVEQERDLYDFRTLYLQHVQW